MGTGKTIATLTALHEMLRSFDASRVLVVAPLRVALHVWSTEIDAWAHVSDLTYRVLAGLPAAERLAAARGSEEIHIINRENLPHLVDNLRKDWPYDTIVLDESRSFKNFRSKRFKAMRRVRPKIDRVIELTGTPAPNGYLDLWAQISLLDAGDRLGKTYTAYRDRHFDSDYFGYNFTLKDGHKEIIRDKISDICLSIEARDHFDLPELFDNPIRVQLPARASEQYQEFAREFILAMESGDPVVASSAGVLRNKLHQVANGFIYDAEGQAIQLHEAKLDALDEIIEEANGMPVLVLYWYKEDLAMIRRRFKQAVPLDKSSGTLAAWNRGDISVLAAHPGSCGHGINLQHGSNIMVWYSLTDDLELFQQASERLGPVRQKQSGYDRPVYRHLIVAGGTVDDIILESNTQKAMTQAELMDALKNQIVEGGQP